MDRPEHKRRAKKKTWFAHAVLRHGPSLRRYLLSLTKRREDAEDIEQEAYLRVYNASDEKRIDNPRAFLFRTAHNLFVQNYRKTRNSPIDSVADFDALNVKELCAAADEQLIARERLGALGEAIDRLPPQARRVFIMRKVFGLSHKEISQALDLSQSTIEKHVAKGLRSCRAYLREHGHDDGDENAAPSSTERKETSGDKA